ncbi:hypothetical protein PCASD_19824 [Puccinia coronata f. sp. avenae]|uniref:Secreted protein n=1 Tax=Puccinia coronata f. sp. avenae TaxID=200324 RepID=A0A2N5S8Q5_9BASI|nr:hypothetical protein PCASD_24598 [Puccinia coronata f. sp. avenae]PLW28021.1 hypothetical protein PCASD_19824 [Puccinia coronata f. sp. avenae]
MFSQESFFLFVCYFLALVSIVFTLATPPEAQTCTYIYQPIATAGDKTGSKVTCRGAPNPQRSFTCDQKSCQGTTECQTCVSQLTNVSVNSIECTNYYVDDDQKTNCWTTANEQFTCYGKCVGAAVCSDCRLDEQTPSISNCADDSSPKKHKAKSSASSTTTSNVGVSTWLSW